MLSINNESLDLTLDLESLPFLSRRLYLFSLAGDGDDVMLGGTFFRQEFPVTREMRSDSSSILYGNLFGKLEIGRESFPGNSR
ncbi:hypothetical protein TorRG33x02_307860 [Trema orientale]|uniref:Uncharacterized protein n=1 Tax=Trema orientale TaxID=63057 RepID=A0A2P5BUZ9_TREOI|nr:hypothetical protein TorRG33x02_307860 [Trema orientale]